jgi:hypothetical protein
MPNLDGLACHVIWQQHGVAWRGLAGLAWLMAWPGENMAWPDMAWPSAWHGAYLLAMYSAVLYGMYCHMAMGQPGLSHPDMYGTSMYSIVAWLACMAWPVCFNIAWPGPCMYV